MAPENMNPVMEMRHRAAAQSLVSHPQEFEREKHAHSVLQFQFAEVKEALRQREEMLEVGSPFSPFCPSLGVLAQASMTK